MDALLVEKLRKSPHASFSVILFGLQKLLALQFACPCDGLWRNRELTAALFAIPSIMSLAIMLIIKKFKFDRWTVFSVTMPSIMWLMLMFLDGRFFTCSMTDWEGRFVVLDGAGPQRWCKPNNSSFICLNDDNLQPLLGCMLRTQEFFVTSQWIGLGLLFYMCLILILLLVKILLDNEPEAEPKAEPLCSTEEKKQININLDDVYDYMLRKSGNNSTQSMPVACTPSVPVASNPPPVPVARKIQSTAVASKSQSVENPMYTVSTKDDSIHNEASQFLPTEDTST